MPRISAFLTAIRKRPEYERRILAVAAYLSGCAVILALGVTSIQQTLSPGGGRGAAPPAQGLSTAAAPMDTSAQKSAPVGPLQALKEAFGAAASGAKGLMAELGRTKTPVAELAELAKTDLPEENTPPSTSLSETPIPVPRTSLTALPEEKKSPPRLMKAASPGPTKAIMEAATLPLYSSYATARLLAAPLAAKIRPPDPEPVKQTSSIGEVVFYNLGELRRTAKDVYYYFAE